MRFASTWRTTRPPISPQPTPSVSTPDQVAGETKKRKRRNRKRTRSATVLRRINARARERQDAWAAEHDLSPEEFIRTVERGQRDLTDTLTRKLGRDFGDLRRADREAYANGESEGEAFKGQTMRAGRG